MDEINARKIFGKYYDKEILTKEEEFQYLEAGDYLIQKLDDYSVAENIGGYYYGKKEFKLAYKYYLLAKELGSSWANSGLGYIYYYGRVDTPDYKKAYESFNAVLKDHRATTFSKIEATFKIADMYKNGYYVEKDINKYREMIESLYKNLEENYGYLPEINTRLASIRIEEGRKEEALELLQEARFQLASRLTVNRFFGDLTRMKWLIKDLYTIKQFDKNNMDLYDLYHLCKEEHLITFEFENERYEIESKEENGEMNIRWNATWYRNIDEFFSKATILFEDEEVTVESVEVAFTDWMIEK